MAKMTKEAWLRKQISDIDMADDFDVVSYAYVKEVINAIKEGLEQLNQERLLQERPIITQGGSRSSKRNTRLSKASREAQYFREEDDEDE